MTKYLSISDDDLCSTCIHLEYDPGSSSYCELGFPGWFNDDGYCVLCEEYEECEMGDNWSAETRRRYDMEQYADRCYDEAKIARSLWRKRSR